MSGIEDIFKGGNVATGLAIGVGVAVLAPVLKPLLRPVAKSILRAGIEAYEQGRVAMAELSERAEDVIAEVRAEMEEEEHAHPAGKVSPDGNGAKAEAPRA